MIVRCIFGCATFLALSILVVPVYYGVSEQKEMMTVAAQAPQNDDSLSFEEIYEIASEGQKEDAISLNDITPAAGDQTEDSFSSGFQNQENPALADERIEAIEEETPSL